MTYEYNIGHATIYAEPHDVQPPEPSVGFSGACDMRTYAYDSKRRYREIQLREKPSRSLEYGTVSWYYFVYDQLCNEVFS